MDSEGDRKWPFASSRETVVLDLTGAMVTGFGCRGREDASMGPTASLPEARSNSSLVEAARLLRIATVDPQLWRYFRERRRRKKKLGLPLARHDACAGGLL